MIGVLAVSQEQFSSKLIPQIQKRFIWTSNKQLKEEEIVDLNREIQTLCQETRQSEENKVIKEVKKQFQKILQMCKSLKKIYR